MSVKYPIGRLCAICRSKHTVAATTSTAPVSTVSVNQSVGQSARGISTSRSGSLGQLQRKRTSGLLNNPAGGSQPPVPHSARSVGSAGFKKFHSSSNLLRTKSPAGNIAPTSIYSPKYIRQVRPPPRLTAASFQPSAPPSAQSVIKALLRRIPEWITSERTADRLNAYGMSRPQIAQKWLEQWSDAVADRLSFTASENDAVEALAAGGWDLGRLVHGLQQEEGAAIVEACYLRHFLTYLVSVSEIESSRSTLEAKKGPAGAFRAPALPSSLISHLRVILEITDLSRLPFAEGHVHARSISRHFHLHVGPTNSGKTYSALKALSCAPTGIYAGPLRLLAHEVWERLNLGTVGDMKTGRACNLLTGEERRIVEEEAGLMSCTVEMLPTARFDGKPFDVVVIDEIQMLGDIQRGGAWTKAVLAVKAKDIHLCGDETTVELLSALIPTLGDKVTINRYERLTPLAVAETSLVSDWNNIEAGDCVVTFSRSNIFTVKRHIEQTVGKKCAVVYGALPPETRAEQAREFNEGKAEVLVASDAVGMGLNLKIKRMIFESLHKFNGKTDIPLPLTQVKQIAGRAGRFGMHKSIPALDVDGVKGNGVAPGTVGREEVSIAAVEEEDVATEISLGEPTADVQTPASLSGGGPGGEVTTLHAADLPILRALLPLPLPSISRAVLDIPYQTVADLSRLLGPTTPYAEILDHIYNLTLPPPHTVLGTTSHRIPLAEVVEEYRDQLTLQEVELLCYSPVSIRDQVALGIFRLAIRSYATKGSVDIADTFGPSGLIPLLERVEATIESLPPPPPIAGIGKRPLVPPILVSSIAQLETLHKSLVFYIWLSFRLSIAFPDRAIAQDLKLRTERVLDECLQRLPGLRNKKHAEIDPSWGAIVAKWRKEHVAPDGHNWESTKKRKAQKIHFYKMVQKDEARRWYDKTYDAGGSSEDGCAASESPVVERQEERKRVEYKGIEEGQKRKMRNKYSGAGLVGAQAGRETGWDARP